MSRKRIFCADSRPACLGRQAGKPAPFPAHFFDFLTSNTLRRRTENYSLEKIINVSEIVYQVGFRNLSYLSRTFKAEFGISPMQYQIKHDRS
ncbi:AraC family transcriptional regulator [Echinicola rosea]|uniref:AraC family transcriptional regulator n=1 Tax=Echinicola rosea TaxID=1807691 RepID=UPI003570D6DB